MISFSAKKKVIESISIVEVMSKYVDIRKKGSSYSCICPFHNDTNPSMTVKEEIKHFRCWVCGASGSVIDFVSRFENISSDQATIKLAKDYNVQIDYSYSKDEIAKQRLGKIMDDANSFYKFYLRQTEEGKLALDYLHNRGLDDNVIEKFGIGLAPNLQDALHNYLSKKNVSDLDQIEVGLIGNNNNGKVYDMFRNRIMFPLCDQFGNVVGFSGRIYNTTEGAKYQNSNANKLFKKSELLYNMHNAIDNIRKNDKVYLFEGFMDVIAAYRSGIDYGVASMGTAFTQYNMKFLLSLTKNIILCFDGDNAGINAMKEAGRLLAVEGVIPNAVVLPKDTKDPDEYLKAHGKEQLYNYLLSQAKPVYEQLYELSRSKCYFEDIVSVENFKRDVYSFLSTCNQPTIEEHYLKLLSEDLNISIEIIKRDYSKVPKKKFVKPQTEVQNGNVEQNFNYESYNPVVSNDGDYYDSYVEPNNNVDVPINVENEVVAPIEPPKVTKAIVKAYRIIIKHSLYNVDRLSEFYQATDNLFLSTDLMMEFSIIKMMRDLQLENPSLNPRNCFNMFCNLFDNFDDIMPYIQSLINDKMINPDIESEFNQALSKIKIYIKKLDSFQDRLKALNGDAEALNNLIDAKKHEISNR